MPRLLARVPTRTKGKLKAAATAHMQALEQAPDRVKKYFQDPRVNTSHESHET